MNYSTSVFAATLAFLMGATMSVAENIPCINPEVLELDDNFRDGFHLRYIYRDFWGDEDKELVLVNAKDETFYLEIYTSNGTVSSCNPNISLQLNFSEPDPWDIWGGDGESYAGVREYGFDLTLNEQNSIIFNDFWFAGAYGFAHSNGTFILKLVDNSTVELIGWESGGWGNNRFTTLSINFRSQRFVTTCRAGYSSSDDAGGWRGEYWGILSAEPILFSSGDFMQLPESNISNQAGYQEFVQGCHDPDNCSASIIEDGSCEIYARPGSQDN